MTRFGVLGRVVTGRAAIRWGMSRSALAALLSSHPVVSVERLVDVVGAMTRATGGRRTP